MTKIVDRYIIKEILKNFMFCLFSMIALFCLYSVTVFLGSSGANIITLSDCLTVSLLKTTISLGILTPLAFYFSIIISFGQLNNTNELVAITSLSYSKKRIYALVSIMGSIILLITMLETVLIRPAAYSKFYSLKSDINARWEFDKLDSEQFYISEDGDEVIFLTKANNRLQNIFIKSSKKNDIELFTAKSGDIINMIKNDAYVLEMQDAQYLGNYFSDDSIIGNFTNMEIYIKQNVETNAQERIKEIETSKLINKNNLFERAELQWRICLPISVIVLTTFCYLIIRIKPRGAKFANLPLAIVCYSTYYIAIGLGRNWVEHGVINNIFIIPLIFFLLSLIYQRTVRADF